MTKNKVEINEYPECGYTYLDEHNMLVTKYLTSKHDALGRNAIGIIAYKDAENYNRLIKGIESCFKPIFKNNIHVNEIDRIQVYRYPYEEGYENWHWDTSRDHTFYGIGALKYSGRDNSLKGILSNLKGELSLKAHIGFESRLWFKALYSRNWSIAYAIYFTPILLFYVFFNRFIRNISNFHSATSIESYNCLKNNGKMKMNILQRLLKPLMFPTFAMFIAVWKIYVLDYIGVKRWLFRICKLDFERSNYVLRFLVRDKFDKGDINAIECYIPTRSGRWTTRLDQSNDRDLSQHPDAEGCNLELDLLNTLYKEYNENTNFKLANILASR